MIDDPADLYVPAGVEEIGGTPPDTPVLAVHLDQGGGDGPRRYAVPYAVDTETGGVIVPFTSIGGRPFMRVVGGDVIPADRIVRIEGMP